MGHGLLYERRRHHAVAAVPHDDMDRTVGCISTRSNCQVQAALTDTLVPLRFRVHSRGLAPHRAGDDPCTSCPFTDRIGPVSPEVRQRQRRADALALLAESSVQSYPSWIAELRHKSPDGTDRRRYAYEKIGRGESNRARPRTCQPKRRSRRGLSPPRRPPWLRPKATSLGRTRSRRRTSAYCYRRQGQSWRHSAPTREIRASPDFGPGRSLVPRIVDEPYMGSTMRADRSARRIEKLRGRLQWNTGGTVPIKPRGIRKLGIGLRIADY